MSEDPHKRPDYDMVDSDADLERWSKLEPFLRDCEATVGRAYRDADSASMRYRAEHKALVFAAASGGMLAVLFAIAQLAPLEQLHTSWVEVGEAVAAFVAVVAVFFGVRAALSKRWILERERAERLRFLKFRFLSSPQLWSGATSESRREWLRSRMQRLDILDKEALEHWAEREDEVLQKDPPGAPADLDGAVLEDLVDYYKEKRLLYQRRYFENQAERRRLWERFTWVAPVAFFFASILAALGHFVYDLIFHPHHSEPDAVSLALILLAACLPVVGAAVRTLRGAHEFGRNSLRFRATSRELEELADELRGEPAPQAALTVLQRAEQVLEAERREWLRLMIDAEWYG